MKVFCTMASSLPSFQGENTGHWEAKISASMLPFLSRRGRRWGVAESACTTPQALSCRCFCRSSCILGDRVGLELEDEPAADLAPAEVLSEKKSPVELERRRAPGAGVGGGKAAWMNVFCTMALKLPSFHGDRGGHLGAASTNDEGAAPADSSGVAPAQLDVASGDTLNEPGVAATAGASSNVRPASAKWSRSTQIKPFAQGSASWSVPCNDPK
mmetsp:Transcript_65580/g.182324  ORF Transcript_65580/g.182324 Transcript_65580/m.182324 type:complete len:214 (+) Transcript_65580:572-1213(+)